MAELSKKQWERLNKDYPRRYTLGRFLMYECLMRDAEAREERKKQRKQNANNKTGSMEQPTETNSGTQADNARQEAREPVA